MGDKSEGPAEKPSFLSTTTGMLTALATTIASVTALVTALYTAGVIGHKSPDNPAPAPVVQHDNSGQTPAPNAGGRLAPAVNTGAQQSIQSSPASTAFSPIN